MGGLGSSYTRAVAVWESPQKGRHIVVVRHAPLPDPSATRTPTAVDVKESGEEVEECVVTEGAVLLRETPIVLIDNQRVPNAEAVACRAIEGNDLLSAELCDPETPLRPRETTAKSLRQLYANSFVHTLPMSDVRKIAPEWGASKNNKDISSKGNDNASNPVDDDDDVVELVAVYRQASLLNHACAPNAVFNTQIMTVGGGSSGAAPRNVCVSSVVVSKGKIAAGEEVTIAYRPLYAPTAVRRAVLLANYGFTCSCARCCGSAAGSESDNQDLENQQNRIAAETQTLTPPESSPRCSAAVCVVNQAIEVYISQPSEVPDESKSANERKLLNEIETIFDNSPLHPIYAQELATKKSNGSEKKEESESESPTALEATATLKIWQVLFSGIAASSDDSYTTFKLFPLWGNSAYWKLHALRHATILGGPLTDQVVRLGTQLLGGGRGAAVFNAKKFMGALILQHVAATREFYNPNLGRLQDFCARIGTDGCMLAGKMKEIGCGGSGSAADADGEQQDILAAVSCGKAVAEKEVQPFVKLLLLLGGGGGGNKKK